MRLTGTRAAAVAAVSAALLLAQMLAPAFTGEHAGAYAAQAQSQAHVATVGNSGDSRYKAVRLTPAIYNNANGDLSDLRIYGDGGEDVPYFVNSGSWAEYEASKQSYPMSLTNAYDKDGSFYFDYAVSEIPDRDVEATSIELSTRSSAFAKSVELYGSYDDVNWAFVQEDTLYSVDGMQKLTIELASPQKYTHYRLKLANNLERISFDSVTLAYSYYVQENSYFIESVEPPFEVEEIEKTTKISIGGLKNLRLRDITIETGSVFMRTASATPLGVSKELYNLSFEGGSYKDTTIQLDWRSTTEDVLVLSIYNGDDRPIDVAGIAASYYADELVFEDDGSEGFTIGFGSGPETAAPVYDIARYKQDILAGGVGRLGIDEVFLGQAEEQGQFDYRPIFNVVVVAAALGLALLIVMKLKGGKS